MFQLVLVHPQIPPNTGQVARACVATATPLHLVRPLGFQIDDRTLRRAGLDYWEKVDLHVHSSLDAFTQIAPAQHCWFFTKHGKRQYDEVAYAPGDWLVFGSETAGLPEDLVGPHADRTVRIPILTDSVRSLNLASAASIALYEALRQKGFEFA